MTNIPKGREETKGGFLPLFRILIFGASSLFRISDYMLRISYYKMSEKINNFFKVSGRS